MPTGNTKASGESVFERSAATKVFRGQATKVFGVNLVPLLVPGPISSNLRGGVSEQPPLAKNQSVLLFFMPWQ